MPDLVGHTLANRYHLLSKLGEGSMASVYRAEDRVRGCLVAVKVMKAYQLGDPVALERFRREAESLVRLDHPHIVRLYELVEDAEPPFLVMDYVEGQNVTQLLESRQGKPLPLAEATRILYEIGGALHFAHRQRVYHRDIKPSNVLLDRSGKAYLTDFGIALLTDRTRLTRDQTGEAGIGPGTPVYMAPEQWLGEQADARTDIYALGALLYELLTGRPPFVSDHPGGLAYQHLHVPPTPPSQWNADIPSSVEQVILKALAKSRDERYPDVATMLQALRAAEETSTGRPVSLPAGLPPAGRRLLRPLVLFTGVGLVLVGIVAGLILLTAGQRWLQGPPMATLTASPLVATPRIALEDSSPSPIPPTPTGPPTVTPTHTTPTPFPSPTTSPTPTSSSTPHLVEVPLTPTPSRSRIAFASDRAGNFEVYVMDEDGTNLARLTYEPARDIQPGWSPDGTRIVFASERDGNLEIYIMKDDGSSPTQLTQSAGKDWFPAWSPDGRWIAFASDRQGNYDLYLIRPDGTKLTQLTTTPEDELKPAWSPDSRRLAFMRRRDVDGDGRIDDADSAGDDLYVLDINSGAETRLTMAQGADTMPAWSPAGGKIAFVSDRVEVGEIYVMREDDSQQTRLTFGTDYDWFPAWSPDSTRLVFQSNRSGNFEIWVMWADGSIPINLTNHPGEDVHPAWTQ